MREKRNSGSPVVLTGGVGGLLTSEHERRRELGWMLRLGLSCSRATREDRRRERRVRRLGRLGLEREEGKKEGVGLTTGFRPKGKGGKEIRFEILFAFQN